MITKYHLMAGALAFILATAAEAQSDITPKPGEPRCAIPVREGPCPFYIAPLVSLVASPEKWHGKTVSVVGYVRVQFEGSAIHVHRTDYEFGTGNGVKLLIPKSEEFRKDHPCRDRYCRVDGVFNANPASDFFIGSISSIQRFVPVDGLMDGK